MRVSGETMRDANVRQYVKHVSNHTRSRENTELRTALNNQISQCAHLASSKEPRNKLAHESTDGCDEEDVDNEPNHE